MKSKEIESLFPSRYYEQNGLVITCYKSKTKKEILFSITLPSMQAVEYLLTDLYYHEYVND